MHMNIPKVARLDSSDLQKASKILNSVELHPIACNNWRQAFPYTPFAGFRMAHNDNELFIRFTVIEECTMAKVSQDNGKVWTDSCVEFFIALDDNGYYNFEFSCIGKALLGFRKERPQAIHASPSIMQTIKRSSTLGNANFDAQNLDTPWELLVIIPSTALFKHKLESWSNLTARINLYKCGDNLPTPHYLSWSSIDTPKPDFHTPRCFKKVKFSQ